MSREFLQRAERVQSSPDPDTATAQTVEIMCGHVRESSKDPLVKSFAVRAVESIRGGPLWFGVKDPFSHPQLIAESIWWFAKHGIQFVHHSEQIWKWLGETDQLQLLISPDVLVRMKRPEGDCADFSMLICALLEALGLDWELVTIKCNPKDPSLYTHVFPRVVLPNGRRETLDASHGKYPGWQVPAEHTYGIQVWDKDGAPIADTPQFDGLHEYVWGPGGSVPGVSGWQFGQGLAEFNSPRDLAGGGLGGSYLYAPGLGCDCSDIDPTTGYCNDPDPCGTSAPACGPTQVSVNGVCTDVTIPGTAESSGIPTGTVYTCPSGQSMVSGVCTDPSGNLTAPSQSNTAAWANFLTAATKAGFTLAEIQAMPAGTVVSPNGQIIRQAPGYAVPVGTSISTTLGTIGSSSMMWILVGLGALLLFSKK